MVARRSGILLHITSLPSPCGIGDLGPWAYRFADFLHESKQTFWQILPLNPTSSAYGNSPYSSCSAFAGNPLLISLESMVEEQYLSSSDVAEMPWFPMNRVDFESVTQYKTHILRLAAQRFKDAASSCHGEFHAFRKANWKWIEDYALFLALKERFSGLPWNEWPPEFRDRDEHALARAREELRDRVFEEVFLQYLFSKQWGALKSYCNERRIQIIGDMPIYVSLDSSDVWSNPVIFKLDAEKRPIFVAGVPPDYFSPTGQRWGNPVYDWNVLRESRYAWWVNRFEHTLKTVDLVRLDHFRGFSGYWEVPGSEETAINGAWVEAPAEDFFSALQQRFPLMPIIAEDLGIITADVREIMHLFGFPGMKVLQFAFYGDIRTNPYAPHNHIRECIVYTGTHDNNTIRGWFRNELSASDRERIFDYFGRVLEDHEIHWELIRVAMMSVATTCIIPMQDFLGLDESARMNLPSVSHGNWEWRLLPDSMSPDLSRMVASFTERYGRA
ncbi:MAG: 4-alpha-glucanotransferase [Deltaproteobacteria bacterium]|nr:4-alpha-glucanotransferase [Deltaproteobacteria bacterium]